ncbi:protein of unknown function (plasmid) [Azospirillum baldaniorum]|uniref:Uncharacterized protein n=1 Tax=Azospirillum baldaniorum TaxID=1064539 RepID=A0A9P1K0S0_9PROT|nr:protein of unknown function [Azospirillum baldaniorum]
MRYDLFQVRSILKGEGIPERETPA